MYRNYKTMAIFLLFCIISLTLYPLFYAQAAAFSYTPIKPFGGKIIKIQACQVPPGLIITVGAPVGGKYFFNFATTQLHAFGIIKPNVWVLGAAAPTPIYCSKGSDKNLPGFDIPGLASSGGLSLTGDMDAFGNITGATISGPLGDLNITGSLGESLGSVAPNIVGNSSSVLGPIGAIGSFASGDFFGGGLTIISMFDPTGITAVITLILKLFELMGINFTKKPPSLGFAYPILHIGTSH